MRKTLTSLAAVAALATAAPAAAGPWDGFYAGIHAGYGVGHTDWYLEEFDEEANHGIEGALGGVQIGYNHEWGQFVLGAEADANLMSLSGSSSCQDQVYTCASELDYSASLRARAGYGMGNWLFYGTGGVVAANSKIETFVTADGSDSFSDDEHRVGWTAGLGVEHIWTPAVSVRAEWRYTDLGSSSRDVGANALTSDIGHDYHQFTVGLNWHF